MCLCCQSAVWALQSQWLALFLDQPGAGRAGRGHSSRLASHIVANHVQPLRSGTANPVTWRNTAAAAASPFTRSYRRASSKRTNVSCVRGGSSQTGFSIPERRRIMRPGCIGMLSRSFVCIHPLLPRCCCCAGDAKSLSRHQSGPVADPRHSPPNALSSAWEECGPRFTAFASSSEGLIWSRLITDTRQLQTKCDAETKADKESKGERRRGKSLFLNPPLCGLTLVVLKRLCPHTRTADLVAGLR